MGVRFPSVASTTLANALPANANETVICTLPPLNITLDLALVMLFWFAYITVGTGTTSLFFRVRRGTGITGVVIGALAWGQTVAAGNAVTVSGSYADTPGAVAGQQYVLTCSQTAATGAGGVNDLSLMAFSL